MSKMFSGAIGFNQTLAGWNVSRVTSMFFMFARARRFDQPLAAWDTSRVTNMGRGLHSFTLELNLSTFGTHSWVKLGYVGDKDSSS